MAAKTVKKHTEEPKFEQKFLMITVIIFFQSMVVKTNLTSN